MEHVDLPLLGLLLFVASLVAIVTRSLRLPYSVGLVTAGILLALLPVGLDVQLTPELVFTLLLPPLVFEAAIQIPWRPFRRELPLLLLLVTLGVALAAASVAVGMHYLLGWTWLGAAFFGVLMAATDPVSVIALFRSVPVDERLHLVVESESLLNDGAAAVAFAILVGFAGGATPGLLPIGGQLLLIILGGLAVGAGVAGPLLLIAWRTEDHLVEITLTTLAAFGSFLLAEHFHVSGVLAALTAGMMVGGFGWMGPISDPGRTAVLSFWEYLAFLANSFVFILIGSHEASISPAPAIMAASVAILLSLVGRAAAVYPVGLLFKRSRLSLLGRLSARPLVGRAQGGAGAGPGAGNSGRCAGTRRHHHSLARGGRILDLRAGADHGAVRPAPGADPGARTRGMSVSLG